MPPLLPNLLLPLALLAPHAARGKSADPYAWLEQVDDTQVMDWVHAQNKRTLGAVGDPNDSPLLPKLFSVVQSTDRIPFVGTRGGYLYNFWQDEHYVRGLWRRTTLEEYRKPSPAWETVLDLDALSEAEKESWVWRGCATLYLGPSQTPDSCLMRLSRGGADAEVIREFNLTEKAFMLPPHGFFVAEAKNSVDWQDRDTLLIGTDCGPGSFTNSGYARTVRRWRRGTQACDSPVVYEGEVTDIAANVWRDHNAWGYEYEWRTRGTSFYDNLYFVSILSGSGDASDFHQVQVPTTSRPSSFADQLVLTLKSDFTTPSGLVLRSGSVAATLMAPFLAGENTSWTVLFEPTANRSCDEVVMTRNYIVLKVLDAVKVQLVSWKYNGADQWQHEHTSPHFTATVDVSAVDEQDSDALWVTSDSFLQPPALALAASASQLEEEHLEQLKAMPPKFNASGLEVTQHWATSKDGTSVPYFLIRREGAAREQPTLLYGYGGFDISLLPQYSGTLGVAWLERGGAYALANIRGGGEFGPGWHQTAMRDGKHKSYEDFAAVAEHLISSGVTSPGRLAAKGGSNGGLLVGNMLVQYPQLFGAIVCSVPLLDMQRYTKLLAGASWIAEYGDPDNATDWAFLKRSSPYHNVDPDMDYPAVLFTTSTRDDRVHPSHARKMTAKLQAEAPAAAKHVFLYETTEGGHGSALLRQAAVELAMEYSFLGEALGLEAPPKQPEATTLTVAPGPKAAAFLSVGTESRGPGPRAGRLRLRHSSDAWHSVLEDGELVAQPSASLW